MNRKLSAAAKFPFGSFEWPYTIFIASKLSIESRLSSLREWFIRYFDAFKYACNIYLKISSATSYGQLYLLRRSLSIYIFRMMPICNLKTTSWRIPWIANMMREGKKKVNFRTRAVRPFIIIILLWYAPTRYSQCDQQYHIFFLFFHRLSNFQLKQSFGNKYLKKIDSITTSRDTRHT